MSKFANIALPILAISLAAPGCRGRDDLDGRRRPIPGLEKRRTTEAPARSDRTAHYDLIDNRASASQYSAGSMVIDPLRSTLAQLGAGRWHPATVDGKRAVLVDGVGGALTIPVDFDPGGIGRGGSGQVTLHLWARAAVPRQLASVLIDERRVGDIAMPETRWKRYSLDIPADALEAGEVSIRLFFRRVGEIDGVSTAAAIGRIALGPRAPSEEPVAAVGPISRGEQRRSAFRVPGPTRLSFYMYVPAGAPRLELGTAGKAGSAMAVRVADDRGVRPLWEGSGTARWVDHTLSLAEFAGTSVRLDLDATGPADWARPRVVSDPGPPGAAAIETVDHVIVWVVSSLRADRLGSPRAPAMSRFASGGVRFSDATTNAGTSGPAHAALMTGRRAQTGSIPDGVVTLSERFREAGFATALISGNGFVHRDAGFASGFDLYENPLRRRRPHCARILWQSARKFLAARKDSHAFVMVTTSEPHLPYTPSAESLAAERVAAAPRIDPARTADLSERVYAGVEVLSAAEQSYIRALYDAEVRDADSAFAEMIADVTALGLADRTAIVLVADHGQELFERTGFGHGHQLYGEIRNIPLAISAPGLAAREVTGIGVELVDVYPTVLALAGVSSNPEIHGENLLPYAQGTSPSAPRPVFATVENTRAVTIGHLELIDGKQAALYDHRSDPDQKTNVLSAHPIAARLLRNTLGLQFAYLESWSRRRWGTALRMTEAFAADHGL